MYLKKNIRVLFFALICIALSSSAAYASNIIIDNNAGPVGTGLFHTSDYANDADCIQEALDYSKSGDTITLIEGDYYVTSRIYEQGKSLNIVGKGNVTIHLNTAEGEWNGIVLLGNVIGTPALSSSSSAGSNQVTLKSASSVKAGDFIKIYKNTQWCPLDYPDQKTGEMYEVKSVSGNTLTLTETLLRDYSSGDSTEISRPIEVNIKNINIIDSGATTTHEGLVLALCKNGIVEDCTVKDSGFSSMSLYSCYNITVRKNKIYNSILPGSGYGVAIWSGSAYISVIDNYIENCRHAITCNTDERISLDRNVYVANNELHGASIGGSNVVDAHACTIDMTVSGNTIYPCYKDPAFADGARISTFENNKVYGGLAAVCRRGSVNDGTHIVQDNYIEDTLVYDGLNNGIGDTLIIKNNIQKGGNYGINFADNESFKNLIISDNEFSNLSYQGYYQKFLLSGVNLNISNNTFENVKLDAIYVDGNSFTPVVVKVQNNTLINVYPSNSYSGITLKNIQNAYVSGNQIFKN